MYKYCLPFLFVSLILKYSVLSYVAEKSLVVTADARISWDQKRALSKLLVLPPVNFFAHCNFLLLVQLSAYGEILAKCQLIFTR